MKYNTKKYLNDVNAVFKSARKFFAAGTHEELQTILHSKDGKQFVCDGYMLVLWNNYTPALDVLPQTEYGRGKQVNPDYLFNIMKRPWTFKVQDNERLMLKHLNEYTRLYPTSKYCTGEPIYIFGHFIGSKLLKRFIALIGTDFEEYETDETLTSPTNVFTDETSAQILPIRITDTAEQKRICEQTDKFIAALKGKELETA